MNTLGNNIKHLRMKQKFSQIELAEKLEVSQTSIAHYEKGTRQPTIETLIQMSHLFNESVDKLIGNTTKYMKVNLKNQSEITGYLVETLINKDEKEFMDIFINKVLNKYPVKTILEEILQTVMYELGSMWEHGLVNEADEHYATAVVRKAVSRISIENINTIKNKKAVSFSVGSEKHTLGIEMVSTYLETLGVNTIYLGSNLPIRSINQIITEYTPDFVFISITLSEHYNSLYHIVEEITKINKDITICIGGQGLIRDKELTQFNNVRIIKNMDDINDVLK